ncbi:hypothetical protein FACS1894211_11770 [Clostridia bacterium]|nr:hypothetical protein FACS1894211_11770 [Clostridia bacterium]
MRHEWLISDAYWHSRSNGVFPSHESVCVLNRTDKTARVFLTLYFEDREKLTDFSAEIPAERTKHIRIDKLKNERGETPPKDVPYAILAESDTDLAVQYTRLDTSQAEMALMTAFAYKVK